MRTNEKIAVVFGLIGGALIIAPGLPDLVEVMGRLRNEFMELNPSVVAGAFGCLFIFLAAAFAGLSLAREYAETKVWKESDPNSKN
jgi:hypothetical protein